LTSLLRLDFKVDPDRNGSKWNKLEISQFLDVIEKIRLQIWAQQTWNTGKWLFFCGITFWCWPVLLTNKTGDF